jgi:hypothetical protein
MKTYKYALLATFAGLVLGFASTGCDRTVSENEKTKVSDDGTVKTKDTKVTEHSDGTVTKTEENKKTAPANP